MNNDTPPGDVLKYRRKSRFARKKESPFYFVADDKFHVVIRELRSRGWLRNANINASVFDLKFRNARNIKFSKLQRCGPLCVPFGWQPARGADYRVLRDG